MTKEELALKIDYEGGIEEAMRYGIRTDEVPKEMEDDWDSLRAEWTSFLNVANRVMAQLREAENRLYS